MNYTPRSGNWESSLLLSLFILVVSGLAGQTSPLVYLQNGSLVYTPFAMTGQDNAVNVIPDFSHAGYQGGGVALPNAPVVQTLSPSGGDDTQMIQQAIDFAEAQPLDAGGIRGAVLLTAGCYQVSQLFIEASGVILRGEGQGRDGTVLYATLPAQHDFITISGTGSGFSRVTSSLQEITTPYVPVGIYSFDVANTADYSVGDLIVVRRTPNQAWIDDLGMDEATLCGGDSGCNGWTPSSYSIYHERKITAISGNTITVNLPIVDVMETQYGSGEVYLASVPGRIEQCGVENLRIESYFDPSDPTDEDHAWVGVKLSRTSNSWVQNVTGQYLGYATVSINQESNFNTVQECAFIDPRSTVSGGRRYSFNISDGVGNLFQRNYSRNGRHDFVTGSRVTGPNVFLDNFSAQPFSDIGPHHRWATGLLFDNVRGAEIRVRNRGSSGSGHGWAGNTTMFWNLLSVADDIRVDSPQGGMNWGIGCRGEDQQGGGYWDNWNTPVLPRSLYLQQLEDRLGPQAVANITIPQQQSGDIYDLLEAWGGEGDFGQNNAPIAVYAAEDAFVRAGVHSDTNFGFDDELSVKYISGTNNNDRVSFIKFNLNGLPTPIYNVKLRLFVSNDAPNAATCELHLVPDDSWQETTVTWNTQPAVSTLVATEAVPPQGDWIVFDITSLANDVINGDGVLSLRLSEGTLDNLFEFSAKDEGGLDEDPRITYNLSPTSGDLPSCATALPVNWTYFTAIERDKTALLRWGTSEEDNNEKFIIERSYDGRRFQVIGEQPTARSARNLENDYEFIDPWPKKGTNYYRIRQVDFDGAMSYSAVRMLYFNDLDKHQLLVYPNPAHNSLQLQIPATTTRQTLRIFDIVGKGWLSQSVNANTDRLQLNISALPPGSYIVAFNGYTQRFIKK